MGRRPGRGGRHTRSSDRPAALLAAVLLFIGSGAVVGAGTVSAPLPAEGPCYRSWLGRWQPSPLEAQRPFLTVPATVRMLSDQGREGAETGRLLVRPRQSLDGRVSWSYWTSEDSTEAEVVYINDFGSIHLILSKRSWGWIGDAVARRGDRDTHRTQARLEAVPCD